MIGSLILTALSAWHSEVLHYDASGHDYPLVFVDCMSFPVILGSVSDNTMIIRWDGSTWNYDFQPYPYGYPFVQVKMDSNDFLWLPVHGDYYGGGVGEILIFHQSYTGWDTLLFDDDTVSNYFWGFTLDTSDVPHIFYTRGGYPFALCHAYLQDTIWLIDTLEFIYDGIPGTFGTSATSEDNVLYFVHMTMEYLICGWLEDSIWHEDTVDDVSGLGDFCFSSVWVTLDRWGYPHLRYYPYYYSIGYRSKYAFGDSLGWHAEFINDSPDDIWWSMSLAVDSSGVVHAAKSDPTGIYHMIHYPGDTLWYEAERIDTFSDAGRIQIAIDNQDYLHVVFTVGNETKLIYATTNPEVGTREASPPEPSRTLMLSMAPSGFLISGYSGPVRVYDATGRLLLSREIKGKTLVGPLNPGVYFVKAGEQREKVAVK